MATIPELREFFLRAISVGNGTTKDQELGFPTAERVDGKLQLNRFLAGHYPTEKVFKKLFASILFKKNVDDRATTTSDGHVRLASDLEAAQGDSGETTEYTRVVQPHHLPTIVSVIDTDTDELISTEEGDGYTVKKYIRTVDGIGSTIYFLEVNDSNTTPPSIGIPDLNDVVIDDTLADGQLLAWNATAGKWVNTTLTIDTITALSELADVLLTSPSNGEVLTYQDGKWVNANAIGAAPAALGDLSDVDLSTPPTGGLILKFDGGSSKWVPDTDLQGAGAATPTIQTVGASPSTINDITNIVIINVDEAEITLPSTYVANETLTVFINVSATTTGITTFLANAGQSIEYAGKETLEVGTYQGASHRFTMGAGNIWKVG